MDGRISHPRLLLAVVLLATCAAVDARAAVFNVASGDVAGLLAAINAANGTPEADTINLAAGTYSVTTPSYGTIAFPPITSDVTIVGAGPASTTIERAAGSPTFRLLALFPEHASRIEGVTLRGGSAPYQQSGSEIQVAGDVTISNCVLRDGYGGAIASDQYQHPGGTLVVENSTITGNQATEDGGAIGQRGGVLEVRGSQIVANSGAFGIYPAVSLDYGGLLRIVDTTIQGNTGGGLIVSQYGNAATAEIVRATIDGNSANRGGGIYLNGSHASIVDSTVSNNVALFGPGGGLYVLDADVTILRSTFSGNSASAATAGVGAGGAIHVEGAANAPGGLTSLLIDSSTISGNSAKDAGGAIHLEGGLRLGRTIRLVRSTVTGNVADSDADGSGDGGGISTPTPVVTIESTILAGNSDSGGQAPDCSGPVRSVGHSLIGTTAGCGVSIGATDRSGAPLLGPLASNGGPTATQLPLAGSPALDAADPATCGFPDQRGYARPVDGDGDTVAACDIGATESGAATPVAFPSDPFLCYAAKTSHGTTPLPVVTALGLADDFESKDFDVKKSDTLCTPAGANGADIGDPDTHLQGRDIKESSGQPHHVRQLGVKLVSPLGVFTVDTVKVDRLLVPASKGLTGPLPPPGPSSNVDRYKCYKARASHGSPALPRGAAAPSVALENQFATARVFALGPISRVCTSVDEEGQGRKNLAANLLCLKAKLEKPLLVGDLEANIPGVYATSEFGTEQLDLSRRYDVCLPALRLP